MTFYKSIPVAVEAYRFDGSGDNAQNIIGWLKRYDFDRTIFHAAEDGHQDRPGYPAQLDLTIPHIKIAEVGDYIVRISEKIRTHFTVMSEDHFKATYVPACGTCSGRVRETKNLVCQTCGHDYSKGA